MSWKKLSGFFFLTATMAFTNACDDGIQLEAGNISRFVSSVSATSSISAKVELYAAAGILLERIAQLQRRRG